jgi:hypothetical protein
VGSSRSGNAVVKTLSVSIRLTDSATVLDVTRLLRRKFQLGPLPMAAASSHDPHLQIPTKESRRQRQDNSGRQQPTGPSSPSYCEQDALVIVGTLLNVPLSFVSFYGTSSNSPIDSRQESSSSTGNSSSNGDLKATTSFHVLRTLLPHQCPLLCRDEMMSSLQQYKTHILAYQQEQQHKFRSKTPQPDTNILTAETLKQLHDHYELLSHLEQEVRWFFQPAFSPHSVVESNNPSQLHPLAFVDLGTGYCTCVEDDSSSGSSEEDEETLKKPHDRLDMDFASGIIQNDGIFTRSRSSASALVEGNGLERLMIHMLSSKEQHGTLDGMSPPSSLLYSASDIGMEALPLENNPEKPLVSENINCPAQKSCDNSDEGRAYSLRKQFLKIARSRRRQRQLHRKAILDRFIKPINSTNPNQHANSSSNTGRIQQTNYPFTHGFLYKRSNANIYVWKRVYCILIEDELWYVSRRKPIQHEPIVQENVGSQDNPIPVLSPTNEPMATSHFWSKLRKISLLHAQITEPRGDASNPLSTVPNVFELRSSPPSAQHLWQQNQQAQHPKHQHHYFRATRRDMQLRWISTIADRIVTYGESHMMNMAEAMMESEESKRALRFERDIVFPCIKATRAMSPQISDSNCGIEDPISSSWMTRGKLPLFSLSGQGSEFVDVIRFGMVVQEYREACRHYESRFSFLKSRGSKPESTSLTALIKAAEGLDVPHGTPVKEIKRMTQVRLQEAIKCVDELWELAAIVCAQAEVMPAPPLRNLTAAEEENEAQKRNDSRSAGDQHPAGCQTSSTLAVDAQQEEEELKDRINAAKGNLFFAIQESRSIDATFTASGPDENSSTSVIPTPPPLDLFDDFLQMRIELSLLAEQRHEAHGLFGSRRSIMKRLPNKRNGGIMPNECSSGTS